MENDRRPGGHRRRALAADLKPFDVCSIGWSMGGGSGFEAVRTECRPEVGAELLVTVKVRRHPVDVRALEMSPLVSLSQTRQALSPRGAPNAKFG